MDEMRDNALPDDIQHQKVVEQKRVLGGILIKF